MTKTAKTNDKDSASTGHGGKRPGAGRKKGSGPFKEPTKVLRVPESKADQIKLWLLEQAQVANQVEALDELKAISKGKANAHLPGSDTQIELPLYSHKVRAGFPSPADDYIEDRLDLNEKLIKDKNATFLLKVAGDSMKDAGIFEDDILIVDRSINAKDGHIVIAAIDGELTVKRLSMKSTGVFLVPENDKYPPIPVKEENDVVIWGVVTSTIHQFN